MPKRRPPRSRRRRGQPQQQRPAFVPRAPQPEPAAAPAAVAEPRPRPAAAPEPARERSPTRFTSRDYSYVKREIARILILASAVIIAIVVLSFFLP